MAAVLAKTNVLGFGGMNSTLHRSASAASNSTPPHGPIGSKMLAKTAFSPDGTIGGSSKASSSMSSSFQYPISPPSQSSQSSSIDSRLSNPRNAAILMRKLPRNLTQEALRSMLLFAKDLLDVEFVQNEYDDDVNFITAVAQFSSLTAAKEVRAMLDGKPNSTGQANMIVEITTTPSNVQLGRRNTVDHGSSRSMASSMSPTGSMAPLTRHSSRFNGTFQSMEKPLPPDQGMNGHQDITTPDGTSKLSGFFSPQSPIGNGVVDRPRMTGKSVIDEDVDEDTGEILKDPVAYLNNDYSASMGQSARRQTNPQIPLTRFSNLSLSTNVSPPPPQNYVSPRSAVNMASPSTMSPNHGVVGGPANFPMNSHQYPRHNYPPVNPADQNPPCNTLYVGNLPLDTSEDELKAMFSKQRGYKRLCFRTKQNGPMCFVEFEDVSFATKALNELYGATLHNSVKGGIRLSFSKNPLGVRNGQPGSSNPTLPVPPQTGLQTPNGLGPLGGQGYMNASGPPPGLSAPPGLNLPITSMSMGNGSYNHSVNPMMNPMVYQNNNNNNVGGPGLGGLRGMAAVSNNHGSSQGPAMGNIYPDYMLGR